MEGVLKKSFFSRVMKMADRASAVNNLSKGKVNKNYRVISIKSDNEELSNFLFSLGCYEGEIITLISVICNNYVINIKDARYSIDKELASAVMVEEV